MSAWSVPRMWEGRTVAILASGESMSQIVADQVLRADLPTIVVNSTYRLARWAALLYGADAQWWSETRAAREFPGLKVSVEEVPGVMRLRHTGVSGFDPDPAALRSGGNSGYAALHLAVHAGAARVLLCGFDMRGGHWHGEHPHPLRNTIEEMYPRWIARFAELAHILAGRGVDVVNCTPDSALECFRCQGLEETLACAEPAAA